MHLNFTRQLTGIYLQEWNQLKNQFLHFTLNNSLEDRLLWRWSITGTFTVYSFYKWLEYGGIPNTEYDTIWKSKIPLKIKIFLWLVRKNKILTKLNLVKKGWSGPTDCPFCGLPESTDHLFTQCSYVTQIWNWISEFNGFTYNCYTIDDLWILNAAIPLKDRLLIELVRGAIL